MKISTALTLAALGVSVDAAFITAYTKNGFGVTLTGSRIGSSALMLASTSIEEDVLIDYCAVKNCFPDYSPIKTGGGTVVIDGFEGEMAKAEVALRSRKSELDFIWSPQGKSEMLFPKDIKGVLSLTRNSSFMRQMVEAGHMSSNAFYVTQTNLASITFGKISTATNIDNLDFIWFPQDHAMPNMWGISSGITGVAWRWNNTRKPSWTSEYNYDGYVYPAYVDIGYSFIAAPAPLAADLINHQIKGKRSMYNKEEKLTLVRCTDTFYSIHLTIDGKKYDVSKNTLVRKLGKTISGYDCFIGIQPHDKDYWVLGRAFLSNFVAAFDNSDPNNARLGLQQTKNHFYGMNKPTDVEHYAPNVLSVQKDLAKSTGALTNSIKHSTTTKTSLVENTKFSIMSGFFAERGDIGLSTIEQGGEAGEGVVSASDGGSNGHDGKGAASSAWDPIWKKIMEVFVWIFDWLGISVFLGFSII